MLNQPHRPPSPILLIARWPALGLAGLLLLAVGCGRKESPRVPLNVLLISIDTCRADYLGCYGAAVKTPAIDALAADGVLFETAIAPVPITLPSHATMLTGTIPPFHGVHDNNDHRLGKGATTLAGLLKPRGYRTGAIVSAFVLDRQFGLDQGFDTYVDRFGATRDAPTAERVGTETSRLARDWLDGNSGRPFFLFVHFFDPHFPYAAPAPFAERHTGRHAAYGGEVSYADHCVGQVIEHLRERGLYDSTLIIVTSDHGEMLGEHGEDSHGYLLYQGALRVPLVVRLPRGASGTRVSEPVGLVDLAPTVCGVLDLPVPEEMHGYPLVDYLRGGQPKESLRLYYCESLYATRYGAAPLIGLVAGRYKYIHAPRPELYDIADDPAEARNLYAWQREQAAEYKNGLQGMLDRFARPAPIAQSIMLSEQDRERLAAIGYLGSGQAAADGALRLDQEGDDPKDVLPFHRMNVEVPLLIAQGKHAQARRICENMLVRRPGVFDTFIHLADIGAALDDLPRMENALRMALAIKPDHPQSLVRIGIAISRQERFAEAREHFSRALRVRPGYVFALDSLGVCVAEASRAAKDPALRHKGLREAAGHFEDALAADPDYAPSMRNLGAAYMDLGRSDDAILQFRNALRLVPRDADLHTHLALALEETGARSQAMAHLRKALEIRPMFTAARQHLIKLEQKGGSGE